MINLPLFQEKTKSKINLWYARRNALQEVAETVGVRERTLDRWIKDFQATEELTQNRRGKHSKTRSPIEDSVFREDFCRYVRENAKVQGRIL